jgi:hypothetical protein
MKFQELDVVRLVKPVPDSELRAGQVGAVVMVFSNPNEAYEVEFCSESGETIAMLALKPDYLSFVETAHKLAA